MKKIFLGLVLMFSTISAHAENLPSNVLVDHVTNVSFAPPEKRGLYHFQVLKSGLVQKIDNKGHRVSLATLSTAMVRSLATRVNSVVSDKLVQEVTPPCMDAPSVDVTIRKTSGKNMLIFTRRQCRNATPNDAQALQVIEFTQSLRDALSSIDDISPL